MYNYNENFTDDLAIGKRGEKLVKDALAKRGHTIDDVSDSRSYADTDLNISKNGVSVRLEVKNDIVSNYTGNVFVETYNRNNVKRGGDGWI